MLKTVSCIMTPKKRISCITLPKNSIMYYVIKKQIRKKKFSQKKHFSIILFSGYLSKASAFCKNFQCHVERGINPIATANAVYNNSLFQTGWDILNIKAGYGQHPSSNTDIMFAAGFLEGVLTAK